MLNMKNYVYLSMPMLTPSLPSFKQFVSGVPHVIENAFKKPSRSISLVYLFDNVLTIELKETKMKSILLFISDKMSSNVLCIEHHCRWCVMIFHFYRSLMGCVCVSAFPGWFE